MEPRPIQILLVEDNPGDVRLTQEALKDSPASIHLNVAIDGVEAMAYLRRTGPYTNALRPDIVLLDLNLPRKDGRAVLREIKQDPRLLRIPVVVLTTSSNEIDIQRSYDLHANCYITKPMDVQQFAAIVRVIENFWFQIVQLPPD